MIELLNTFGALASVVSAAIAVYAAVNARRQRDAVDRIRASLNNTHQAVKLTQVSDDIRLVVAAFTKYSAAAGLDQLEGVDYSADAAAAQRICNSVKNHLNDFVNQDQAMLHVLDRAPSHIGALSSSRNRREAKRAGEELYLNLVLIGRVIERERSRFVVETVVGAIVD